MQIIRDYLGVWTIVFGLLAAAGLGQSIPFALLAAGAAAVMTPKFMRWIAERVGRNKIPLPVRGLVGFVLLILVFANVPAPPVKQAETPAPTALPPGFDDGRPVPEAVNPSSESPPGGDAEVTVLDDSAVPENIKALAAPTQAPAAAPTATPKRAIADLAERTSAEWAQADASSKSNVVTGTFMLFAIDPRFKGFDTAAIKNKAAYKAAEKKMVACMDSHTAALEKENKQLPVMMVASACGVQESLITEFNL